MLRPAAVLFALVCWLGLSAETLSAATDAVAEPGAGAVWDRLAAETDALYAAAVQESRQAAFVRVQRIIRHLDRLRSQTADRTDGGLSEAWRLKLGTEAAAVRKSLADGRPAAEWQDGAASLKLAVDALRGGSFTLWQEYEELLRDDAANVAAAWRGHADGNAEAALEALRVMQERTARLEAAAWLEAGTQESDRLHERLRYTEGLLREAAAGRGAQLADEAIGRLDEIVADFFESGRGSAGRRAMAALFPPAGGPSWQWPAAVWTIICSALLYAGWRKYRGDRGTPVIPKQ